MTPLHTFEAALSAATTETEAFDALCVLTKATVGAKLFTVMVADMANMQSRRAYTDDPEHYPTSGTKPITMNRWFEQVHGRRQSFVANTLEDISTVFPDYPLIGQLGCGSVVNLPVILGGKMVGTANMLDVEGHYTPERVEMVRDQLTLPAMAAMAVARQLAA